VETCIQSEDTSNDAGGYIHFVGRPANGEGRVDEFYDHRDALGGQSDTNGSRDGSQYKDECRDSEHERMSWRIKQGPLGAGERYERLKGTRK
jgi:hypothetical protein